MKWMPGCRPTCMKFGPYHAFDCRNHPGTIRSPYQHPQCSHCRHENAKENP